MQPITVRVPDDQCSAIAAEVQRRPGFDGDQAAVVRVWLGPALELELTESAADRLADALVDAIAADDAARPVLFPPMRQGPAGVMAGW